MSRRPIIPERALDVMREVCAAHSVTLAELCGECRTRRIADTRMEAYWRLRNMAFGASGAQPSLPQIGVWMNRDHTTVLSGLRKYEAALAERLA